jgi:hypothetical protein
VVVVSDNDIEAKISKKPPEVGFWNVLNGSGELSLLL